MTEPPLPPSPPQGPPLGTYFSRRKATMPSPPRPALTLILAVSKNILIINSYSFIVITIALKLDVQKHKKTPLQRSLNN